MARIYRRQPSVELRPNQRFALIGKTGSGKTTFATTLSALLVPEQDDLWQDWWLDTKGDPTDLLRLKQYGYQPYGFMSSGRIAQAREVSRIYFRVAQGQMQNEDVVSQSQAIIRLALERQFVVVIVDEYTQVVESIRNPGKALGDAFRTGRGLNVGIIGCTQEPVYVPRQLFSQATHIFLFDLFFEADIEVARRYHPGYIPPSDLGDAHGFWWGYTEGAVERRNKWRYFRDQDEFLRILKVKPRRTTGQGERRNDNRQSA